MKMVVHQDEILDMIERAREAGRNITVNSPAIRSRQRKKMVDVTEQEIDSYIRQQVASGRGEVVFHVDDLTYGQELVSGFWNEVYEMYRGAGWDMEFDAKPGYDRRYIRLQLKN